MRELLLNNRANNSTPFKKLRQLLVLFALVLMPVGAWADSYFAINTTNHGSTFVTDENKDGIFSLGDNERISYDVTNNVLTLKNVSLTLSTDDTDAPVELIALVDGDHQSLTIKLVGNNTVTLGRKASFFSGTQLTFTQDGSASLTINTESGWSGNLFIGYYNTDPITPTYNNDLSLEHDATNKPNVYTIKNASTATSYGITVGNTQVTSANAANVLNDDYSSVSYDATTNTLTLKGVHLNSATGDNNISATSALKIHLEGYSTVGTINVNDVTFTTNVSLPGLLRYTSISGNTAYENGLQSGTDSNNKNIIYSSSTNPYIIYATGYKVQDNDNTFYYWIDNGDIQGWSNEDYIASLDVSSDLSIVGSQNNAIIDYFKVSTTSTNPTSCYIYPASLEDMNLVNKVYFLFDWGTCTNKDVKVQIKGLDSNYANDGTYSEEVSLPADGGLVEIPLTGTVNSYYFQIYFSSSTGEFSFIPISVGFLKTEGYDLYIDGTQVTSANASDVLAGTANAGKVSFEPASSANSNVNTLTLDGASFNGSVVSGLENLTVLLKNDNTITRSDTASVFNSTNNTAPLTFKHEGDATLTISNKNYGWPVIWNFASIEYATDGLSLISPMPVKYAEAERPNPTGINNFVANGLISAYKDSYILNTVTFTTANAYPLWIAGTQVTENNENNIIAGAAVTFTPGSGSNKARLSLTNTTLEYENLGDTGGHIISGVGDLEIYFSGSNKLSYADSSAIIRSIDSNATLTFTAAENSSLALASRSDGVAVIRGFKSITMGDGVYQETEGPTAYSTNPVNDYDGCNKGLVSAVHDNTNGYYPVFYLKLSTSPTYPLWVHNGDRYFQATDENKDDVWDYKTSTPPVVFTPATSTLTLNSVLVDDCPSSAIYSGLGDLTIDIQGANTIAVSDTASIIRSTNGGKLTITKTGTTASLQLQNNSSDDHPIYHCPVIKDFTSFELSEGLYLSNAKSDDDFGVPALYESFANLDLNGGNSTMGLVNASQAYTWQPRGIRDVTISTNESYPIWVAHHRETDGYGYNIVYTQITPTNKDDFLGDNVPKVSFIPASTGNGNVNTLKLNGADITDAIFSNLANLTIEFSGTNTLCNDGRTEGYIHGSNPNAIITFKALSDNSSISLDCANGHAVVEGFANVAFDNAVAEYSGSFSYDQTERKYKNNYGELSTLIIKAPTSPTMEYNDEEKVVLSKPYPDGDIYYTINYVDDNVTDVEKTKYSEAFALDAPGTVEAWAEANGATTSKTKGKHFGYKDAPFSMVVGDDPKTPELIPTILDEDAIELAASDPTTSDAPDVATFVDGVITPVSVGTANLTTTLESSATSATEGTVILNKNDQITTAVTVSIVFNYVTFAEGQSYATYCNTDADDLTLPEGITAYAVRVPTSGNYVEMEGIDFLPGNSTGYYTVLLKRDATSRSSFGTVTKYERKPTDNPPVNHLHFTTAGKDTDGRQYILYNDEFVKATGTIRAPYGYLESPNANPARGFMIGDGNDGSTAIDATLLDDGEANHDEWYDLQGRRIAKPTKAGLYINNGKKMVINNK